MKRRGFIFENIYTMKNLELAHERARKDKRFYKEVKMVDADPEKYLSAIQDMLKNKTYTVGPDDYTMFLKNDKGKVREIYKLNYFPHRIIQHALLIQIEDDLYKNYINNTFASIPTRGTHKASFALREDLEKYPDETVYCLQLDVKKFYPNVDHEILKRQFRRKFKDDNLFWLTDMLIDSMEKGIAIGSLFSQWAGNYNLSPFDHWMKEEKGVRFYYRYMDDIIILSDNKEELHELLKDIKIYFRDNLNLEVKGNYKVYPVDIQGIDFVGYRHFRYYVLLRKTIAKDLVRAMRDIQNKMDRGREFTYEDYCTINSYRGWVKWCNGHNLYVTWIKPLMTHHKKYYDEVIKNEGNKKRKKHSRKRSARGSKQYQGHRVCAV